MSSSMSELILINCLLMSLAKYDLEFYSIWNSTNRDCSNSSLLSKDLYLPSLNTFWRREWKKVLLSSMCIIWVKLRFWYCDELLYFWVVGEIGVPDLLSETDADVEADDEDPTLLTNLLFSSLRANSLAKATPK